MKGNITLDNTQLQIILNYINTLKDHTPYWKTFIASATPVLLSSLLGIGTGIGTALYLEHLKTKRESDKIRRERREKELALLSGTNTAIAFNIEALIHTTMQEILPHYEQSRAACLAIDELGSDNFNQIVELINSRFLSMIERCPKIYLEDIDLPRNLPFLIGTAPNLIILSGWITTYAWQLKSVLRERNRLIDRMTIDYMGSNIDRSILDQLCAAQAHISEAECVDVYLLLSQLELANQKITTIIKTQYEGVAGPRKGIQLPDIFNELMSKLKPIAVEALEGGLPPNPSEN
jgi:hypothetical protein